MESLLDSKLVEILSQSIEFISHNCQKQVDAAKMKEIKKICRISEAYVGEAFKILMHHLSEKHSEVRLASFFIVKELFGRSHHFRELLSSNFQDFSKQVFDIDPKLPLPPPKSAAKQLKLEAIKSVKEWNSIYGDAYKKLKIGFRYLQQSRMVDFDTVDDRSAAQRREDELRESRVNSAKQKMLESLKDEIASQENDLLTCLIEMQNAFDILLPDEFALEDSENPRNESASDSNDLREHGILINQEFSLTIDLKPTPLKINADNKDVVGCLREQYQQLESRFWPLIVRWNIAATKAGAEEQLQKRILDLKTRTTAFLGRYKHLGLDQLDSGDSSDSDLETVPDHEIFSNESLIEAQILSKADHEMGAARVKKPRIVENKTLPRDIDSYQASQSSESVKFPIAQVESYWVRDPESEQGSTDVIITPVDISEEFHPVKWTCRAPLPSGKLCPRKDRVKCPLHGPIVARDDMGNPVDPSSVQSPYKKPAVPDWQDPALLADIKAATGVDLTMPVKGKRSKKNPFPNLTDIKKLSDTSRQRLESKIFKRRAVRKVASSMDALDAKRQEAKFGNQWSYS